LNAENWKQVKEDEYDEIFDNDLDVQPPATVKSKKPARRNSEPTQGKVKKKKKKKDKPKPSLPLISSDPEAQGGGLE
jgi:hypothetical protein